MSSRRWYFDVPGLSTSVCFCDEGTIYMERRLSNALFFTLRNLENFATENIAMIDAHGYVHTQASSVMPFFRANRRSVSLFISAWGLKLLVS